MFGGSQGRDVIFLETAVRLGDSRSHAQVEAIPVTGKQFSKAPIMFKKVRAPSRTLTIQP